MESLAYLYLINVKDFSGENWQWIYNEQNFSLNLSFFLKSSKTKVIPLLILSLFLSANLKAIAIVKEEDQGQNIIVANQIQTSEMSTSVKLGDQGENVTLLQKKLQELGFFKGQISGFYGSLTQQAVTDFQQNNNLPTDGEANTNTLVKLGLRDSPVTNPSNGILEVNQQSIFTDSYGINTYIYRGDKGDPVKLVQEALTATGHYKGEISGIFDQTTENALKEFQKANNIEPDGIVGIATRAQLIQQSGINRLSPSNVPTPTNVVKRGDSGNDVVWVQEKLKVAGFLKGNITGFFGVLTETAVKDFQRARNLNPDGIVGATTRNALTQVSAQNPPSNPAPSNPSSTTSTMPTTLLRKGNSGSSVRWVQEKLKQAGFYNSEITGVFGDTTETAVKRFQQARNLTVDGIVGAITRNALNQNNSSTPSPSTPNSSSAPTTLVKRGDSGSSVRWVQEKLKQAGFYNYQITGVFGALTESGVKEFQRARKLTADGIVGANTRNALNRGASSNSTTVKNSSTINTSQGILRRGDSNNEVRWLQEKLTQLGFYKGPVTGVFGPLTETSVKQFQSAKRLTADGIVGRNTHIALNDAIAKL
jgi:peptidoglycan hydrolase-like protein with peptidoglycan-binding domain